MNCFKFLKSFMVMDADAVSVPGGDGSEDCLTSDGQMEPNPSKVTESSLCVKLSVSSSVSQRSTDPPSSLLLTAGHTKNKTKMGIYTTHTSWQLRDHLCETQTVSSVFERCNFHFIFWGKTFTENCSSLVCTVICHLNKSPQ